MSGSDWRCIFCWEEIPLDPERREKFRDDGEKQVQFLQRVLTCLANYVKVPGLLNEDLRFLWSEEDNEIKASGGISFGTCEECGKVVKPIWKIYCELLRIRLEMDVKLEALVKLMEVRGHENVDVAADSCGLIGLERLQAVGKVRREIREKCRDKVTKSKPTITLEKVKAGLVTAPIRCQSREVAEPENRSMHDFLMEDAADSSDETDEMEEKYCPSNTIFCEPTQTDSVNPNQASSKEKPASLPESKMRMQYSCKLCPKQFWWISDMRAHLRKSHKKEYSSKDEKPCKTGEPLTCPVCGSGFNKNMSLILHMKNYYSAQLASFTKRRVEVAVKCPHCSKSVSKAYLSQHIKAIHQTSNSKRRKLTKRFTCPVTECLQKFPLQADLDKHKKLHGTFSCKYCSEVKTYASDLSKHELEAHFVNSKCSINDSSSSQIECPRCHHLFQRLGDYLHHHVDAHLGLSLKVRTCTVCQSHLTSEVSAALHFKLHHKTDGVDPIDIKTCDQCPAYFLKINQLNGHKNRAHGVNPRTTCPYCSKVFGSYSNLVYHRKAFHGYYDENPDHPLPCNEPGCSKRFCTKDELDWHKKICSLSSKQPGLEVSCSECSQIFNGRSELRAHMKTHKIKLNHICEHCGRDFPRRDTLVRHYLFHKSPEEWDYQCQECGKKCPTVYRLQEHSRVHTGEKPWECQECKRKFANKMNWKHHMKKEHNVVIPIRKKAKSRFLSKRETN